MPEKNKFNIFTEELVSLEKKVYLLVQKNFELTHGYNSLLKMNDLLNRENEVLKMKIEELESNIENESSNIRILKNIDNKEEFKQNIDELVKVIDYHLRS